MEAVYTEDALLENIYRAKKRFFNKTRVAPTCVTIHVKDFILLKKMNESFHTATNDRHHRVFGLKILKTDDIKRGYVSIGIEE